MATYALVQGGLVVNTIEADAGFASSISNQYDVVIQSDRVGPGWTYDGSKLIEPPVVRQVPLPRVTRVIPNTGIAATSVSVYGSGFTGANTVTFGGMAASNVVVVSDTQITCVTPVQLLKGDLAVVVSTSTGANPAASNVLDPSNFRYT